MKIAQKVFLFGSAVGIAFLAGYLFAESEHWGLWGIGILFAFYFALAARLGGPLPNTLVSVLAFVMLSIMYFVSVLLTIGAVVLGANLQRVLMGPTDYSASVHTLTTTTAISSYSVGVYAALFLIERPISIRNILVITIIATSVTSVVDYVLIRRLGIPSGTFRTQIYFTVLGCCYLPFIALHLGQRSNLRTKIMSSTRLG